MTADIDLELLAQQVGYLRDRQAILDSISRYIMGVDRHDNEIILSAYHADAIDEHGSAVNPMPDFADWVNNGHASWTRAHTHNLTTHSCQIEGDVAHAETYVLAGLAASDESHVRLCGARYVDRLERREGEWKISLRKVIIDWIMTGDASDFHQASYKARGYPAGTWDTTDPAYQRPLVPSS